MTTFTIDNSVISVAVDSGESYTPATGEIQKVTINAKANANVVIDDVEIKENFKDDGEPNTQAIPVILDDTQTVDITSIGGAHISGFVIN